MGIVNKINQAFLNKIPKMFWYNPFCSTAEATIADRYCNFHRAKHFRSAIQLVKHILAFSLSLSLRSRIKIFFFFFTVIHVLLSEEAAKR